jgi:cell division protein FtsI/penicillin-binding protein 2
MIGTMFGALAAGRTRLRRARNLRAGARGRARAHDAVYAPDGRLPAVLAVFMGRLRAALRLSRLSADGQAPHAAPASAAGQSLGGIAAPCAEPAPAARQPLLQTIRAVFPRGPVLALAAGCLVLAVVGAVTIVLHARGLAALVDTDGAGGAGGAAAGPAALQPVLAGVAFTVPAGAGVRVEAHGGAALLLLSGMRAEAPRHVDLCSQLADPAGGGRLLPLYAGLRFTDVPSLVARGASLRNAMLARDAMPRATVSGDASAAFLTLRWQGRAQWIGDAGAGAESESGVAALGRQGWLLWGRDGALRVLRRPSQACPRAGELVLQLYRPAGADAAAGARALAVAFPAGGAPAVETFLAPGSYQVPSAPAAPLEDQQLFAQLRARGLVRLGADGLIELAPPDLAAWRAQGRTPWDDVVVDADTRSLLDHLHTRADGDFVRAQVGIFNAERKLLAWRVRADSADAGANANTNVDAGTNASANTGANTGANAGTNADAATDAATGIAGDARAEAAGVPVLLADAMPAAGSRLFDHLPQGWAPWRRVASWPAGAGAVHIVLPLAAPARPGQTFELMLAGRLGALSGARVGRRTPACLGRACRTPDDVQTLELALDPGAREVALDAAPLPMDALAMPGDARYRHIVLQGGQPVWHALPAAAGAAAATARPAAHADVVLVDRGGRALWHDGAPTAAAQRAGLGTLLGVRAEQEGGVAGMLARLPGAGRHEASLTIELALQETAQAALDCIGMRRGHWDGGACSGGAAAPAGRQAGLVVVDADTGAILAAAGAGNAPVDAANWREARDFDRLDPAASPLRLPAWQHDGGAERSPGSTFKIVSALGLELAAQRDRRLDALLDGMPLAAINRVASAGGWAFRTEAPTYPVAGGAAHGGARITNFRDQGLDRRAQDGRLGLSQALTYSLNTWFAWAGELSDATLLGAPAGGAPDLQPLAPDALDDLRPIVAMARRLGFGQPLHLDGGLLPADFAWSAWDALQATPAGIDPVHTRHELRQMAIGLRMQATPLQMALVAAAVGEGRVVTPHLLARLDGRAAVQGEGAALGVRLDRIRAGLKGVVDAGTAAGAFRGADLDAARRGLSGKTGTAPLADGRLATVWFTGWLEPHSLPGQTHRLAFAVFVSRSEATGGEHAAPIAAAVLRALAHAGVPQPVGLSSR